MLTISHASSGVSTCSRSGLGSQSTAPSALSTRVIAYGCERMPSVANVVYALTISIG